METDYFVSRHEKLLRFYGKNSKTFSRLLTEYYNEEFARIVEEQTRTEYVRLIPELPYHAGKPGNVFNKLMPMLALLTALYLAMKANGRTVQEFVKVCYESFEDPYRKMPRFLLRFAGKIMFGRGFVRKMQHISKDFREANDPDSFVFNIEYVNDEDCEIIMETTQCGMITFLRKHGAEEILPYCNMVDFQQSHYMNLGISQRSCIGYGDETCVYCFKRGRETKLPSQIQEALQDSTIRPL